MGIALTPDIGKPLVIQPPPIPDPSNDADLIATLAKETRELRAQLANRKIGDMLVTKEAAASFHGEPQQTLVDVGALDGKELLDHYHAKTAKYATAPFDPAGDLLRFYPGGVTIWSGFPGAGKCLAKGTPVLMADGSIKAVEDVAVGDALIGPDSNPRRVLALGRGRETMYRITPTKGDPYIVNESHILSLKGSGPFYGKEERATNISVRDYLRLSSGVKEKLKGWRSPVDWIERDVPVDPYFLGAWLGDGSSESPMIHNTDDEVLDECAAVAVANGLRAVRGRYKRCSFVRLSGAQGRENWIYGSLRDIGVTQEKHVPLLYKANSRRVRFEVLAGLIDTDGSLRHGGYDFVSVNKRLAEDVAFLARSLGLAAYVNPCRKGCQTGAIGDYFRVFISGDCSQVPVRIKRKRAANRIQIKRVLVTGITVEPIGEGDYYGFQLDGDGLFLLGDFTVTHNTTVLRQFICHTLHRGSSVFLASLEEDPRDVLVRIATTAAGQEPTAHHMQWFIDAYAKRFRLWGTIGIAQHARLLATVRELAEQGIKHMIIDSLMCLDIRNDDTEAQRKFANLIATTARASKVHIHLVAHPRKLISADQELDLNDVAGAREIGGIADNVIFIRRTKDKEGYVKNADVTPMCVSVRKQRHFNGALGDCPGWYMRKFRQFHSDQYDQYPTRYLPDDAYREIKDTRTFT